MNRSFFSKTAVRLGLGFATLLIFTIVLAVVSGIGLNRVMHATETIYEDRTMPLDQLGTMQFATLMNRVLVEDMLINPTTSNIDKHAAEIKANAERVDQAQKAYLATYLTEEEKGLAKTFVENRTRYLQEGLTPAINALKAGSVDKARRLYGEKIVPLGDALVKSIDALIELQVREAKLEYESAKKINQTVRGITIGVVCIALLIGIGIAVFVTRSMTRQLGAEPAELAAVANEIAAGNLALMSGRQAVPGSVMASMQAMQQALTQLVRDVRSSVDSVSTASAQIAAGNQDLSTRTEQQASSLQQTAASMEQLTGTVKQSADNARQANQFAASASEVAARGGRAVGQVVSTMEAINSSSKKISDIIAVIDGIAFQTNILALNAAVEAARAGEQGRGFAVVAGEVRNLAQRSAQAAREIKDLIHDSVEKVENGTKQVAEAGQTMDEIVAQVKRVTDLIGEISSASMEQSSGISQVNSAVTLMDEATQQNAALVEQSAAAAASLNDQAKRLTEAVAVFKLSEAEMQKAIAHADAQSRQTIAAASTVSRAPAKPAKTTGTGTTANGKASTADTGDWAEF